MQTNASNQALERTATRRATFRVGMIKIVSVQAALAVGGGRSS
jgi:hypothetical protein